MKNIPIFLTVIVFFLFVPPLPTYGQGALQDCFDMKLTQVRKVSNDFFLEGTIFLDGVKVSSNNQLTIAPMMRTANGQRFFLSPVIIQGKSRYKLYQRSLKLNGPSASLDAYAVTKTNAKYLRYSIPYHTTIPYQSWMKNSSLYVVADLCGCSGSTKDHQEKLIGPSTDFSQYAPLANLVVPQRENLKKRSETGEAYLIFEQGKWEILPHLFNNKEELDKIDKSLTYIGEEPTATIMGISIKAYASPEGTYEMNMQLSKNRAKALLNYIQRKYTLPRNISIFSEGYGEDWDRLVDLIQQDSRVENRNQVLQIIKTVKIFDGREVQLMDLNGGRPYRYMLDNLFPLLRRSDYQIEYAVPEFSLEKAEQLLETKPNMLSLDEMYRIAATRQKGSPAFNKVFKIAGQTYPNDPIACINASTVAIWEKDYATAKQLIEKWSSEPKAWNNLGIVCMSELRLDEAEWYLLNAKSAGINEAAANLEILQQLKNSTQLFEED